MEITIVRRNERHRYECFSCELTLNVREEFRYCPNCQSVDDWHEMS